jgi:hypothetical protein
MEWDFHQRGYLLNVIDTGFARLEGSGAWRKWCRGQAPKPRHAGLRVGTAAGRNKQFLCPCHGNLQQSWQSMSAMQPAGPCMDTYLTVFTPLSPCRRAACQRLRAASLPTHLTVPTSNTHAGCLSGSHLRPARRRRYSDFLGMLAAKRASQLLRCSAAVEHAG